MGLLHEIQAAILQDGADLGPILLKLRLLAARIGSQPLAEWVRHESEGYPHNAEIPDYRFIPVTYTANFSGPFGSGIKNAPISSYLVTRLAGKQWVRYEMRESIAAVDDLLAEDRDGSSIGINASDLIHLFQGNVYPDYECNSVTGGISRSSLASIRHAVRSRVLELTLELEKSVPDAAAVTIGPATSPSAPSAAAATQIAQQIIYGNFTAIAATGDGATIQIAVAPHDANSLAQFLTGSGMAEEDAKELARLAASETPESNAEPMGPQVRNWLVENLKKAASGTWKMGIAVATDVVKEALLKYYGLK
ncbi:hypothetical protein GOY18_13120 [Aeromonas hydrophila]|uniref:AbiTii domain-containing protein n=1 Tax=Aeromonas hydrophila TaxID=644 RepID=UPI001C5A9FA4|nr:hypothetical protein [Aeromonas hydrophila]MBW3809261.1 hypothetical protein [Aeromonas hydrophila]UCM59226.1 hypothetical protein LEO74_08785 [Aeromonas hydrophila]